jgi:hypothetical protein
MIVMRHTFEVDYGNGRRVTKRSTLIDYGLQPEGYSSMARTVSLPLAVAIVSSHSCFLYFLTSVLRKQCLKARSKPLEF